MASRRAPCKINDIIKVRRARGIVVCTALSVTDEPTRSVLCRPLEGTDALADFDTPWERIICVIGAGEIEFI